ncbi:hyaluronoglucuronidase [Manduca sexta]|uniref:Heparanase n=1 Tax=Manduca sexta TaxID=7130 RepID=A0A922CSJ5_MANSE|nr:hyaluronoglucuronidase [Manduca sexta]KAG6456802.1 hypothetical protein O3G_MSEX009964 [Manduca sexta]
MDHTYLFLLVHFSVISLATADTYSVKIDAEHHVNLVDSRFLSFTIDPKYLFSSSGKYDNKECICMASALTPSYLRIAGPSTAQMSFHNATISIDEGREAEDLAVGYRQWRKFLQWAQTTGFDLVFALNNQERMPSGMWDPNTTLNILTVAEKAHVGDIFWQLGYECTNQSIEEYLNDLETLRVIIETFSPGRAGAWKVVGGDVTGCLHADSKSDFKDYVMLSTEMMDAIMLNGNSSAQELERMTESERLKLLKLLTHNPTPLWLTETTPRVYNELERAVDWLTSLGYSARNGFSVHYRELLEEEMYEPSLSFYMALLFKNLVGEKVLNLEMDPEQAIIFGHCTSLRHQPVSGAVTLYGANMDDEPARFSLKLSKREEGGDIMQFILAHDHSGNIVVNGRAMYYEGDIRPVVKRVRPYKTLLINLPPKSFGFWVLANTNIEACQDIDEETIDKDSFSHKTNKTRVKRSYIEDEDNALADLSFDLIDPDYTMTTNNEALAARIKNINSDLRKATNNLKYVSKRVKRKDSETDSSNKRKFRKFKPKAEKRILMSDLKSRGLLGNLLQSTRRNLTRSKFDRNRKFSRLGKTKVDKRSSRGKVKEKLDIPKETNLENQAHTRRRRSTDKATDYEEITANEINDSGESAKVWKILQKIHKQLKDLSLEKDEYAEEERKDDQKHHVLIKTKVTDDSAAVEVGETDRGFIKTTVTNLMDILNELNKNMNKIWNAITFLE